MALGHLQPSRWWTRLALIISSHTMGGACYRDISWWRHQMETFSALLAICAGNSPASSEFPAQKPVTQNFDVFFDLSLNKRLRKQSWGWWFETISRPLWCHRNVWKKNDIQILKMAFCYHWCNGDLSMDMKWPQRNASHCPVFNGLIFLYEINPSMMKESLLKE